MKILFWIVGLLLPASAFCQITSVASFEYDDDVVIVSFNPNDLNQKPLVIVKREPEETPVAEDEPIEIAPIPPYPVYEYALINANGQEKLLPEYEKPVFLTQNKLFTSGLDQPKTLQSYNLQTSEWNSEPIIGTSSQTCDGGYGTFKPVRNYFYPINNNWVITEICPYGSKPNQVTIKDQNRSTLMQFDQYSSEKVTIFPNDTKSIVAVTGPKYGKDFILHYLKDGQQKRIDLKFEEEVRNDRSTGAKMIDDGILVVMCGYSTRDSYARKIDFEGNTIWERVWNSTLDIGAYHQASDKWLVFTGQTGYMTTINHYTDQTGILDKMVGYEDFFKSFQANQAKGETLLYSAYGFTLLPSDQHFVGILKGYSKQKRSLHRTLIIHYNGKEWQDILISDDPKANPRILPVNSTSFAVILKGKVTLYRIES